MCVCVCVCACSAVIRHLHPWHNVTSGIYQSQQRKLTQGTNSLPPLLPGFQPTTQTFPPPVRRSATGLSGAHICDNYHLAITCSVVMQGEDNRIIMYLDGSKSSEVNTHQKTKTTTTTNNKLNKTTTITTTKEANKHCHYHHNNKRTTKRNQARNNR